MSRSRWGYVPVQSHKRVGQVLQVRVGPGNSPLWPAEARACGRRPHRCGLASASPPPLQPLPDSKHQARPGGPISLATPLDLRHVDTPSARCARVLLMTADGCPVERFAGAFCRTRGGHPAGLGGRCLHVRPPGMRACYHWTRRRLAGSRRLNAPDAGVQQQQGRKAARHPSCCHEGIGEPSALARKVASIYYAGAARVPAAAFSSVAPQQAPRSHRAGSQCVPPLFLQRGRRRVLRQPGGPPRCHDISDRSEGVDESGPSALIMQTNACGPFTAPITHMKGFVQLRQHVNPWGSCGGVACPSQIDPFGFVLNL